MPFIVLFLWLAGVDLDMKSQKILEEMTESQKRFIHREYKSWSESGLSDDQAKMAVVRQFREITKLKAGRKVIEAVLEEDVYLPEDFEPKGKVDKGIMFDDPPRTRKKPAKTLPEDLPLENPASYGEVHGRRVKGGQLVVLEREVDSHPGEVFFVKAVVPEGNQEFLVDLGVRRKQSQGGYGKIKAPERFKALVGDLGKGSEMIPIESRSESRGGRRCDEWVAPSHVLLVAYLFNLDPDLKLNIMFGDRRVKVTADERRQLIGFLSRSPLVATDVDTAFTRLQGKLRSNKDDEAEESE